MIGHSFAAAVREAIGQTANMAKTVMSAKKQFFMPVIVSNNPIPQKRISCKDAKPRHPDFAARLRLNGNYHRPTARHGGNEFRFGGGLGKSRGRTPKTLGVLVIFGFRSRFCGSCGAQAKVGT
ncbi:MAG: hypothetical protein IKZ22_08245 [Kiritimatiellae bacterium]|nr:hypothetical protein [Kiritimatiellia bacterium]